MKYIGSICKKHPDINGLRYKSSRGCVSCSADARKRWRRKNNKRAMELQKRWRDKDADKVIKSNKAWRDSNPNYRRERYLNTVAKYPNKLRLQGIEWRRKNPEKIKEIYANRRALKIKASCRWRNKFFISEAYDLAALRTKLTGIKWHVDHIVPLRSRLVCGLHNEFNVRVIPKIDNLRKSNLRWPDMPSLGCK